MNNLLTNIINSNHRRNQQRTRRNQSHNQQRRSFQLSNIRRDILQNRQNEEPIMSIPIEQQLNNNIINNTLAITGSINNINNENNTSSYYSSFHYDEYNIRYFHNNTITEMDTDQLLNYIVNNMNTTESITLNDSFEESTPIKENTDVIKEAIKINTTINRYEIIKDIIKNNTCPITLVDFELNTYIALFNGCNHGIEKNSYEKYIKIFIKCPLCNNQLY